MAVQRVEILGVGVDICAPQNLEDVIMEMISKPGTKQIVFLSVWDLLKARRKKNPFHECVKNADLVLPVSKSILAGAKFLKKDIPVRYNPFTTLISILTVLENHTKSLYMLGERKKSLMAAERNVSYTFPNLQIVGRYVGFYPKSVEKDIISAIYKAAPSLVLMSDGIKEKDCWSYNRRNQFSSSIFLYYRDAIGIFGERKTRVNEKTFERGLEIWREILHNPLKIFLIFPFVKYIALLVRSRLFKKEEKMALNADN